MKNTIKIKTILFMVLASCCLYSCGIRKTKKQKLVIASPVTATKPSDSTKTTAPVKGPKKFSDVVKKGARTFAGLLTTYEQEGKYLLEIPDSLLGREVLVVSRIAKSASDSRDRVNMLGYAGDQINNTVIRFEKGNGHKLFIRKISFAERAVDTTSMMYRSVMNSNIQPIIAAFEIKALSAKEDGLLVDITDYLNGDNDLFFFNPSIKQSLSLGGIQADRSAVLQISSHPKNMEIRTMKTYAKAGIGGAGGGFASFELNTSILMLPKELMHPRFADARIGYFGTEYTDFESHPQGVTKAELITRWRLEPKPQDIVRYMAGELVEPSKQIVFYIDPTTPKKWVPYLIQGVNDWNVAFEKAGFKNAIVAKEAPTKAQDSTWSLEDARHSAIVYKPSDIPNASGPHVHDPRTGEILESHVNWHHNVMRLLRNWYMIQAGSVDKEARKAVLDDQLMGQLIRFVSSHEVGHTLGLRHNFGSSSTVPVEKLRDKNWLKKNGHTPSIMDYARFNYVAQPEDNIGPEGIFPRIGDYDLWAIEWAYRWYPANRFANSAEEKAFLNQWIIERTGKNKRLWFGQEMDPDDPRSQSEDLGDNAMKAGAYGIRNLKHILPKLEAWTHEPNSDYQELTEMYTQVLQQYSRYVGHVVKNIGGVMTSPKNREQKGVIVEYVSKSKQREAMGFLQEYLFKTPSWLLNRSIFDKTKGGSIATISKQQDAVLSKLLSPGTIFKLCQFEGNRGSEAYRPLDMIGELQSGIFSELLAGRPISIYRRNLQKSYVEKLLSLLKPAPVPSGPSPAAMIASGPDMRNTDMVSVVRMKLKELQRGIRRSKPVDVMSSAHLEDLAQRIESVLKITNT